MELDVGKPRERELELWKAENESQDWTVYLIELCEDKHKNQHKEESKKELERNMETRVNVHPSRDLLKAQLSAATRGNLGECKGGITAQQNRVGARFAVSARRNKEDWETPCTVLDRMSARCTGEWDSWLMYGGSWANGRQRSIGKIRS